MHICVAGTNIQYKRNSIRVNVLMLLSSPSNYIKLCQINIISMHVTVHKG